jgi:hypothetical protein
MGKGTGRDAGYWRKPNPQATRSLELINNLVENKRRVRRPILCQFGARKPQNQHGRQLVFHYPENRS